MTKGNPQGESGNGPRLRVLFVITLSEFGGAQRFLSNFLTHLDRAKYDPLVLTGETGKNDFLTEALSKNGITVKRLRSLKREINLFYDFKAVRELASEISAFRPDTIFLNSSKAGFLGSLAANFLVDQQKPKIIYRIGGWSFNDPRPLWQRWLFIIIEAISSRWKDVIIVNNQKDLNQAKKFFIRPRQQLLFVPNCIDAYKINFLPREEARSEIVKRFSDQASGDYSKKIMVGTIANLYPAKGVSMLVSVAGYLLDKDNLTFTVIGDGPERETLEKNISENGLSEKVQLVGQLAEAYRYLNAFDIFIIPSVKEGSPWVLLEAMAAKLPIIATAVGSIPEIIQDGRNGLLVEPAKPQQIVQQVNRLLENEFLRKELGIQAHQTLIHNFSEEKMLSQIESVLK
jgi:glycosyltransferase involved in cell wall biosynthesis